MTEKELVVFKETLRCLSFNGVKVKDFASKININPHTLYNYICGQAPSKKYYDYIIYTIKKEYPIAFEQGKDIANNKEKMNNAKLV